MPDVIAFGEAMVRLAPPPFRRIEQTRTLDVTVGGAELNAAVGVARLGHSCGWVSRLTDNALGRLIANHAREAGVSTDHCVWTDEDRVGLYFFEFGAAPRPSGVLYDRKDSAFAAMQPGAFDWPKILAGAKWFHSTGITPAVGAGPAGCVREALTAARAAGLTTSIDLNYRAKLWSLADAGRCLGELVGLCDYLITTREDIANVFGIDAPDHETAAARVAERFGLKSVALTMREGSLGWRNTLSAMLWHPGGILRTRSYEVEIVDRLGAGDGFAAGYIHGVLTGDLQKGLDWGVASSALKHTIPSDFAWVTRGEVEALLGGAGMRVSR
jgi:2-dehydro-3-deoxygluconokinase